MLWIYGYYICFALSVLGRIHTSKVGPDIERVNPYSAGTDFSRQNVTSVDVTF